MNIKEATEFICEKLDSIYCDTCKGKNTNYDICDECYRKNMNWSINEDFARKIAESILTK